MRKIIAEKHGISKAHVRSMFGLFTLFAFKLNIVPGIIVISFHHIFINV